MYNIGIKCLIEYKIIQKCSYLIFDIIIFPTLFSTIIS